jgi:hypothetical protein
MTRYSFIVSFIDRSSTGGEEERLDRHPHEERLEADLHVGIQEVISSGGGTGSTFLLSYFIELGHNMKCSWPGSQTVRVLDRQSVHEG